VFDLPTFTYWKVENGLWVWYRDKDAARQTPFGTLKEGTTTFTQGMTTPSGKIPDFANLRNEVKADRNAVVLTAGSRVQSVSVTNSLPGPVDLQLDENAAKIQGLSVRIEKKHLEGGEKTEIRFEVDPDAKVANVIRVLVSPINIALDIQVNTQ
jgi:hypothetical protein